MEESSSFENFELHLSNQAKEFLRETAKWAYLLSIVGFIFIGLMIVLGIFMGTMMSTLETPASIPGALLSVFYIGISLIYLFPVLYLYRFASKMKKAFAENNNEDLEEGFKNLKSHYKFIGVATLILIGFYAIVFLVGIFSAATSAF